MSNGSPVTVFVGTASFFPNILVLLLQSCQRWINTQVFNQSQRISHHQPSRPEQMAEVKSMDQRNLRVIFHTVNDVFFNHVKIRISYGEIPWNPTERAMVKFKAFCFSEKILQAAPDLFRGTFAVRPTLQPRVPLDEELTMPRRYRGGTWTFLASPPPESIGKISIFLLWN